MTTVMRPPVAPVSGGDGTDRPVRRRAVTRAMAIELVGSFVGAIVLMFAVFSIEGLSVQTSPLGFIFCTVSAFFIAYAIVCWRRYGLQMMKDRLGTAAIWVGALVAFVPLIAVILYVIIQGGPVVFAKFPHFFTADFSQYTGSAPVTAVGAGAAIVGTLEEVALAAVMTVPLGIATATYLVNSRSQFSKLAGGLIDAMTGVPAIIPGIFIYVLWVVPRGVGGKSGFAAAMGLGLMMYPIVTRASQEVIAIVPASLTEASLALGSPRWRNTLRVTLPTARVGLATAIILGIARVAGETAPILFLAGGNSHYNFNPFSGQQDNLPLRIYQQIFQFGTNTNREAWGVSFVLVLVIILLFLAARIIGSRGPEKKGNGLLRRAFNHRLLKPEDA
jgi:phosphate transport system permease protein